MKKNKIISKKLNKILKRIKSQKKQLILAIVVLFGPFVLFTNQSLICDKISDTCNSKILWFDVGSVKLSDVLTADFEKDKHGAKEVLPSYNTKLITKYSQSLSFYFFHSNSEFKAQTDSIKFNDFLTSNKTHFEAKSGFANLAFWKFY